MKKTFQLALVALLSIGIACIALLSGVGGVADVADARQSVPLPPSGIPLEPSDSAKSARVEPMDRIAEAFRPLDWLTPVNVSNNSAYDDGPEAAGIAASQLNNTVSIVWSRTDGDDGYIMEAHNTAPLDLNFVQQDIDDCGRGLCGSMRSDHDAFGRRHVVWWQQTGGTICDRYALIEANGVISVNQDVPGTCGFGRKNVALGVSPDGTVHAFFARNTTNDVFYYQRSPAGIWVVIGEQISASVPGDLAGVSSSLGIPMLAWKGSSPGGNSDIFTATRIGPNNWVQEDISFPCCTGCANNSRAYLPALAPDPFGGIRASWSDEHCDPRTAQPSQDIYYREWIAGSGWNNQPIVRVNNNVGYSSQNSIAVDSNGRAHIAWSDTIASSGPFQFHYSSGQGTVFAPYTTPFLAWAGGFQQKDVSIDTGPGYAHVTFGSDRDDRVNKDNYYSYISYGPPPTPTFTPTNTYTPTPPITNTPTRTPTPCTTPGIYTDVAPSDYFYQAALQLGRDGIMTGYADCTFRPYNNITRGQTAKIVILASNRPINTAGGPHFRDVPNTNPFYIYIETAYNDGIISGYSCGTGCLEFLPGNNVTRGQFCKMVVLSFNFTINLQGAPHFRDVLQNNPFFNYIETAYNLELISGYSCGTGCLEFRPNNNLTRGQAAKIVHGGRELVGPTGTPTHTATSTAVVVTATATETPVFITATPSVTPIIVTATATETPNVITATPTLTAIPTSVPTDTPTSVPTSTPVPTFTPIPEPTVTPTPT